MGPRGGVSSWADTIIYFGVKFISVSHLWLCNIFIGLPGLGPAVMSNVFEAGASFCVEWRSACKFEFPVFDSFFASIDKIFILG